MPNFILAPSLLAADFARFGEEAAAAINAGADWIHLDIMDNHYVPNLTFGPALATALRKFGITAPLDVHLMVRPVDDLIVAFAKAGATYITFHPEASDHIDRSLQLIKSHGCKAGLVFNPATPFNVLDYVIDKIDLIMLMSVNPGFSGQTFLPSALKKLQQAREIIDRENRSIRLEIDGGVKMDNIKQIAQSGADTFVIGSAFFANPNYPQVVTDLRSELAKA